MLHEESCQQGPVPRLCCRLPTRDCGVGQLPLSVTKLTTGYVCACCRWPPRTAGWAPAAPSQGRSLRSSCTTWASPGSSSGTQSAGALLAESNDFIGPQGSLRAQPGDSLNFVVHPWSAAATEQTASLTGACAMLNAALLCPVLNLGHAPPPPPPPPPVPCHRTSAWLGNQI